MVEDYYFVVFGDDCFGGGLVEVWGFIGNYGDFILDVYIVFLCKI